MADASSLPRIIQDSLSRFVAFLSSVTVAFGRSGNRHRAMRSDRRSNIAKVVEVMLLGCNLQHGGLICHISKYWARPLSIPEIAQLAGMTVITVARCIADLVDLGLLESSQIKRKSLANGQFEVSVGLRCFTDKFWEAMGLLEKFKDAVQWAKKHARRKLHMPFKAIGKKINEATVKAGDILKTAFKFLDVGAIKVQSNCDEIRSLLRQNK